MEKSKMMSQEEIGVEISKLEAFWDAAREYARWRLEAIKPAVKELRRRERQAKKAPAKKHKKDLERA